MGFEVTAWRLAGYNLNQSSTLMSIIREAPFDPTLVIAIGYVLLSNENLGSAVSNGPSRASISEAVGFVGKEELLSKFRLLARWKKTSDKEGLSTTTVHPSVPPPTSLSMGGPSQRCRLAVDWCRPLSKGFDAQSIGVDRWRSAVHG
jgi:hypothetical protein